MHVGAIVRSGRSLSAPARCIVDPHTASRPAAAVGYRPGTFLNIDVSEDRMPLKNPASGSSLWSRELVEQHG